jgi:predicted transcriptional regulator
MGKEKHIELKSRLKIYNYILKHPGLHFRELCRRLNMRVNNLDYHLNYLVNQGLLTISSENKYNTYYPVKLDGARAEAIAGQLANLLSYERKDRVDYIFKYLIPSREDKEVLNIFRRDVPRKIIRFLALYPDSSLKNISKNLQKHNTTISFHLKKLIDVDVIERISKGNVFQYRLKNEEYLLKLGFLFVDWKERVNAKGECEGRTDWTNFDTIVERIYDIFPHPYHV